jgi:hypothetical protein
MAEYRTGRFAEANAALITTANFGDVNASGTLVRTRPRRVRDPEGLSWFTVKWNFARLALLSGE